jgi:TIR domain
MSDIFISYRRADGGWARSLCTDLKERFAVFFDIESIDYGENFPRRIEDALRTCRVFLVMIGPEWLNSRQRLQDDRDWVRREILSGIERQASGVRVVPLTIGGASLPDKDTLPEELRPLMAANAFQLTHHNWKSDLTELRNRIENWLRGSPGLNPARQEIPPHLPYLCDRIEQEEHLIEHWPRMPDGSYRLNPVIVLHGHRLEEHDSFPDRLKWRAAFAAISKTLGRDVGFRDCLLNWNRNKAKEHKYDKALRSALKRALEDSLEYSDATDQVLRKYLETLEQPLLVTLQITWTDYKECGKEIIGGFARTWKSLFTIESAATSTKEISPAKPAIFCINIAYDKIKQKINLAEVENEPHACALPKLEAIQDRHITEWIGLKDVKRFVRNNKTAKQLTDLPQDEKLCFERGKIHMYTFAQAVKEILTAT